MTFEPTIPPPSASGLVSTIGVLCLLAGVVLTIAYCGGCAPASRLPAYCTDEDAFTARLLACVDEAAREERDEPSFRAHARVCRSAVHERCGITYVSSRDGGTP